MQQLKKKTVSSTVSKVQTTGRDVVQVVQASATSDGAGVKLYRSLGGPHLPELDPFLMLDEFRSDDANDYIAGFPDHPHRGFETVTYMLAGAMRHRDSVGNEGHLRAGGVQWMTAGRGIIHSEMPEQENGLMWGFQLWVNLPAKHKMTQPRYQDLDAADIPQITLPGGVMRLIAGDAGGPTGAVKDIVTEPLMLDITLSADCGHIQTIPEGHNAFVYVFEGKGLFGKSSQKLAQSQLGVLNQTGDQLKIATDSGVRFLLLAGKPIGEPIARRGPFVMNTEQEVYQAFLDFQTGEFT